MKPLIMLTIIAALFSCNANHPKPATDNETNIDTLSKHLKPFKSELPTIGLLIFNGVLQGEVIATSDVFGKPNKNLEQLFNVITIAETLSPITTEEGMHFVPDYTFENCPQLTALFVPSGYDMYAQVHNKKMVDFIKRKNEETTYIVSNCAGAQLIGEAGIADGHKIVTYIGGGKQLQKQYPNLKVQNDSLVTFVEDGKFSSSNGNLTSYISALNLLEKMTSTEHKEFIQEYLYIDQLQNWKK
ncbi:DJ-1/PfpI family protein [Aureispira anguillae]|uniref:DJ-1/PfpI family protein n=1 Tax=Aureispira anguillae TaxID=2864201 RepID=A0A915YKF2_9BACT|nr:DJ-1/PfpI family protein [Aureispira anguillae]BDS14715.1 DJ-1/PfpI family protein [Aureispira anguillae]